MLKVLKDFVKIVYNKCIVYTLFVHSCFRKTTSQRPF